MSEECDIPRGLGQTPPPGGDDSNSVGRTRWEQERGITFEFFRLLIESKNSSELLDAAIDFFQQHSRCEAVGIRLRDGNDIPFFCAHGFSEEFLLDANCFGGLVPCTDISATLNCRCADVIYGRTDSTQPTFTAKGSFWTNGVEEQRSGKVIPPRCSADHYQSVALIPLKAHGEGLGLIQFNDRRTEMFTPQDIALWEMLADHLASAIAKFRTNEALRFRDAQFRFIFENLSEGLVIAGPNGLIFKWNSAAAKMHGFSTSPDEDSFRNLANVFEVSAMDGTVLPLDNWPIARVLRGESIHEEEFLVRRLDRGNWRRVFRYGGTPISEANGRTALAVITISDVTDRKHAEEALRLSEERSQGLMATISDGLSVNEFTPAGMLGHFVEVNDVMCQQLGYTRGELLSMTPYDLDDPTSGATATEIAQQLREKSDLIFDRVHVAKDGTRIPVRIHARLFNLNGRPALISLVRDTSERRRTEQALRESEQRLIQAVNVARLGIFEYDHKTRLVECSPTFRTIYGLREEDPVPLSAILERVLPEDEEWLHAALRQSIDPHSDGLFQREHRIVHPDGIHWVLVRAQTFFEGDADARRPVRTVGAILNITERKQAELQLLASQRQLRTALDAAKLGVWSRDLESGNFDCDELARWIFGWTEPGNVTVNELVERIVPEDRQRFVDMRKDMLSGHTGSDGGFEFRVQVPQAEVRWILIWGNRSRDRFGNPTRLTGVVQDITERKQAEQKIKALEQKFLQAQKMEAVGRLAGGMAHDFNNLLMVIRSYTEIIQESLPADERLQRNAATVIQASDRAASLTRQMLAFSRKQVLSPVALNLNSVVIESGKMLIRLIGEDIELQVKPAEDLWIVKADPDQISQVMMNLSVNARDAMPEGGLLTIATRNVSVDGTLAKKYPYVVPGDYATVSVSDTGTGISKEVQEQMFEPFFTTKNVGKGTGLGLSTVYGIVKQSGGYLLVESELERGTCFTMYLPRMQESASETEP